MLKRMKTEYNGQMGDRQLQARATKISTCLMSRRQYQGPVDGLATGPFPCTETSIANEAINQMLSCRTRLLSGDNHHAQNKNVGRPLVHDHSRVVFTINKTVFVPWDHVESAPLVDLGSVADDGALE